MSEPKTGPDINHAAAAISCPGSPFLVRVFGLTGRGRVRLANEDSFLIAGLARTLSVHATSLPDAETQYSSHRGNVLLWPTGWGDIRRGKRPIP